MLNRFQLNNEGVWASKTVSSAQCIAWPSPTLFLLLVCQAVNIVDSHRYRLQQDCETMERRYRYHSSTMQQTGAFKYINVTCLSCSKHLDSPRFLTIKEKLWREAPWWHDRLPLRLRRVCLREEWWTIGNNQQGKNGDILHGVLAEEDLHHILQFSANWSTKIQNRLWHKTPANKQTKNICKRATYETRCFIIFPRTVKMLLKMWLNL